MDLWMKIKLGIVCAVMLGALGSATVGTLALPGVVETSPVHASPATQPAVDAVCPGSPNPQPDIDGLAVCVVTFVETPTVTP